MQDIRVAILDANALTRSGLQAILIQTGLAASHVLTFADTATLQSYLEATRVNILLLSDGQPEGEDITRLVSTLHRTYPGVGLVVLSTHLQVDYIRRLFNCGVRGFIYRKGRLEEIIVAALRTLSQGEIYLSPEAAALPYLSQSMPATLDERDLEVLYLLAKGYKVKEIARSIEVNRKVIYRSREKLRRILQVGNNEQIVPAAISAGLLKDKTPQP